MSGNQQNESLDRKLDSIEAAIQDIRDGKIIIVVDDEDRENEGDFICAAEKVTPELVNFMATHGRGLICTPLTEDRCKELNLKPMVQTNTSHHETAFTISVDLIGHGCSTGISAYDRSTGIRLLTDPNTSWTDYARPGHIFPLIAKDGGVLRRAGHTEAAVDLARLAGLAPAGVLVEILNEDGTMARLPDLLKVAEQFDLKIISIADLIKYRVENEKLVERLIDVQMPTEYGDFQLIAFEDKTRNETHLALKKGDWKADEPVLVRVHSSCQTGDILGSLRCDCGPQLHAAMKQIEAEGKGLLLYIMQEGRGIGLLNKLKAYKLQEQGYDTVEANLMLGFKADERDYGIGAQILRELKISKMRLMTNNPTKRIGLIGYGLEIVENVELEIEPNEHNEFYLFTKRDKMGHNILDKKKS
ncbi:bifunctional 3,4-dihydroxy-2-butanone-4-phosphate synthase/GTP cyclohydrolase II [Saprospira sp. CCB-QB6]|uniref:bifunctional 3,4-dihydroxy-2-butanone-4-phosphate synthase/GTP cyclohydrolase II n=1 Tax=Saprospira sp. CCB-QB6 TaxID=3023936 RepID=UPI003FA7E208